MRYENVFQRYELKYILTQEQKKRVIQKMLPYMALDNYGHTTIRNLYFDTDNYRLIRRSIEKPAYKEKLRIRSYKRTNPDSTVFVELKKKYNSIVYKRRISLPEKQAMDWLNYKLPCKKESQIAQEIQYFLDYYETLHPTVFLSYEREAYYSKGGDDFRVTFDENILCRQDTLSLDGDVGGAFLLDKSQALMELKVSGGIPLWMTHILSEEKLYKTSFSKYGTAYQTIIYPKSKEDSIYV